MFRAGDLVLVSVSGGADSICLLYSLWHLRRLMRVRLAVFHFDHRLRTGSAKDAEYVRGVSGRLGVPFHLVEALTKPRPGQSVEAWGHRERFASRLAVARDIEARRIATGHTLDDQAESVLMAAITGSGRTDRLAGIPPVSGQLVRPLLNVSREETQRFCRSLGLRPRRDPTNEEDRFLRNVLRRRVIPSLEREVGRQVRTSLARTGAVVRRDAEELARQAEPYIARWLKGVGAADEARLPAADLRGLPPAIGVRVVQAAFSVSEAPFTDNDVTAVLDLARGRPGRRVDLSQGLKARRDREYVRISLASPGS
jgi:tRNA(Ile)-lysidine synthase